MSRLLTALRPDDELRSKRAVIYLRVSTKEQAEKDGDQGYSIPAQRDACRRKADSLGAEVVDEFIDAGESARSADRPELQRMLAFAMDQRPDYLIVHKVDRLARNLVDDAMINVTLQEAGVTLVSCSENIDETPSGKLLHGIMASIAEFYSRNLATEALKGMTQKASRGGTVGTAPIGYRNVGRVRDGREARTVELDPERAPLIKWAFESFATGEWTLTKLHSELATQGLRTAQTRSRASKPLSRSRLHATLRNRYYIGKVNFRGVEYDGVHPKLVDLETFTRVQTVLDGHRAGEKTRSFPHYLKSSVFCGKCGSRLCITKAVNRFGTQYLYFFCLGRQQRRTKCDLRAVPVAKVEEQVILAWSRIQIHPDYAALLQELIQVEIRKQEEINANTERRATQQIDRKRAERKKLLDAYYHEAVSLDMFKAEQIRLTKEVEALELRLVKSRLKVANLETVLARTLAFLADPQTTYREAPPALRRQFNQAAFERFDVYTADECEGIPAEPVKTLLKEDLVKPLDAEPVELV